MSIAFIPSPFFLRAQMAQTNDTLQGRTIVVTGASRGIGRGLAVGLGEHHAHVIVTGRTATGKGSLEETAEAVQKAGGTCDTYLVDHSDDSSVKDFFTSLSDDLSRSGRTLDCFVNNAFSAVSYISANAPEDVPFWERATTDKDDDPAVIWDTVNNVGLRNNYVCSVLATRLMLRAGGVIVNITSMGGLISIFDPAYCVGKSGIDRMSAEFALHAPPNVSYIAFCPFTVATEEMTKFAGNDDSQLPLWNMETPLYVGRTLAKVLADNKLIKHIHGKVACAAEIGDKFGVADENDFRPLSVRSPRFLALTMIPSLIKSPIRNLIPRRPYVPWWMMRAFAGAVKFW